MTKRVAIALLAAVLASSPLPAQRQAFDVASVKPFESRGGAFTLLPSGEVRIQQRLAEIIALAYEVPWALWRHKFVMGSAAQKLGLPEYPRFEIHAKGNPANDPKAMLRTLLHDRFGLRMHRETRQVPVYALTLKEPGKLGRWLQPSPHNCREWVARGGTPGDANSPRKGIVQICYPIVNGSLLKRDGELVRISAGTISELIKDVQGYVERPIIDMTGLNGNYVWEAAGAMFPRPGTLFSIFEEQLGLRFEPRVGPLEVLVIDDLRMPTLN